MKSSNKLPLFLFIGFILVTAIWLVPHLFKKAELPTFHVKQLNGEIFSQDHLKGKVSIINFWATSCSSCIKEMPQLIETYLKYQNQGVELIAIAMSYDSPEFVKNFAESRQLPFKIALDSQGLASQAFGSIQLTPTTILIGKDGKIIKQYIGEPKWTDFYQLIESALQSKA